MTQGLINVFFRQIKFLNPMISRKPKLQRQKKLFMQKGKVLRPNQMNINVAAWGRLIKNIQPSHEPIHHSLSGGHGVHITSSSAATPITPGQSTVLTGVSNVPSQFFFLNICRQSTEFT